MLSGGLIPGLLAGALAGTLAMVELFNSLRKPPCLRATHWVVSLFAFDATAGLVTHALLGEALKGLSWFVGVWPILLAGLCGPALLRSQLALLGSGQEPSRYGPAARYGRIRHQIEEAIDRESAAAQAHWMNKKAVPCITGLGTDEFLRLTRAYLKGRDGGPDNEAEKVLTYIEEVAVDGTISESARVSAWIQSLMDNGDRRYVRSLVRNSK